MRLADHVFVCFMIALFLGCVLRDPRSDHYPFRSFDPLPDAVEYAVVAANIHTGVGPYLSINHNRIPSRYPFGFPLLIIPFYQLLGDDIANAYYASVFFGALSIALMFSLARSLFPGTSVAHWATFFLGSCSLFLTFSALVMSEVCSIFLALLALNLAARLRPTSSFICFALLGLILGYAVLVRTANILIIAPVQLYLLLERRVRLFSRSLLAIVVALGACAVLLLVYNAHIFGSFVRNGYTIYTPRTLFSWDFFRENALPYVQTLALARGGKSIWLEGPFYGWIIPPLAAFGLVTLQWDRRRSLIAFLAAWVASFYVFYSFYFFYDFRFFLPALPLLFLTAAIGLSRALRSLDGLHRLVVSMLTIALYLAQPFSGGVSPLRTAAHNRTTDTPPANYHHVREINAYMERVGAQPGTHFVLSALNLVYHDYYSSKRYTLVPLSQGQEYERAPEIAAIIGAPAVDALLDRGCVVYASDFRVDDAPTQASLRELAEKYRLERVADIGTSLFRVWRKTM
jgi:hypothetical protein